MARKARRKKTEKEVYFVAMITLSLIAIAIGELIHNAVFFNGGIGLFFAGIGGLIAMRVKRNIK